ncbi:hypothetical protein GUJ93_ZPchr0005g15105 [Zizania palustris]|uniref:Uncharacterized protein n=1 Tax=Zizania palustris TaxID=103762 RepID=A0A8J5VIE7_ZIZPA|nr:hypothetical protein GUJ93_ZPchr0005g15105 [Zizania palustris]
MADSTAVDSVAAHAVEAELADPAAALLRILFSVSGMNTSLLSFPACSGQEMVTLTASSPSHRRPCSAGSRHRHN